MEDIIYFIPCSGLPELSYLKYDRGHKETMGVCMKCKSSLLGERGHTGISRRMGESLSFDFPSQKILGSTFSACILALDEYSLRRFYFTMHILAFWCGKVGWYCKSCGTSNKSLHCLCSVLTSAIKAFISWVTNYHIQWPTSWPLMGRGICLLNVCSAY